MSMNQTPQGERLHIALFGLCNAGKSSLINAITGQDLSIVSDLEGTTTDPVSKAMEILPLGPVMLIDTPGLDDEGKLGGERIRKAKSILNKTDIAVIVADGAKARENLSREKELLALTKEKNIPSILVLNKQDEWEKDEPEIAPLGDICVSAKNGYHIHELKEMISHKIPAPTHTGQLVGDLVSPGELAVLVVPIDSAAPKGRLILPQQQVIRDLLETGAISIVCRDTELTETLKRLKETPRLVITDSQVFAQVASDTPKDIPLTSFSILFAQYKGDLKTQLQGVKALETLRDGDRVLMAEGCTHHRQCEDIGTVKLPRWICEYTGMDLIFETSSGGSYPENLQKYAMVVHCGGCTLSPGEMTFRIAQARKQRVPIVNYGILIAQLKGVLERSIRPFPDYRELL